MRMLMTVQIPTAEGNAAISGGQLPAMLQKAMEQLKPEAAYFYAEDGRRAALIVFDMAEPSQIPVVAEPWFQGLNATVDFRPVMIADDVQAGLGQL